MSNNQTQSKKATAFILFTPMIILILSSAFPKNFSIPQLISPIITLFVINFLYKVHVNVMLKRDPNYIINQEKKMDILSNNFKTSVQSPVVKSLTK